MNCPHCGAERVGNINDDDWIEYACGTETIKSADGQDFDSRISDCYERQISQLKAELSQCVRRDNPKLMEILKVLDDGSYGHSSWQECAAAKVALKYIIEGK